MIKLSWLQMAHPHFQSACQAIWDCPSLDAKTSYTAHRIQTGIAKVEKDIRDLRIAICDKYAAKDADGKLINDERGWVTFETPEKNKEFEAEFMKEFNSRSVELQVNKIDFEKLAQVRGITPRMWEHLEAIMENLPTQEPEATPSST